MIEELDIAIAVAEEHGYEGTKAALCELRRQYLESMFAPEFSLQEQEVLMRVSREFLGS